MFQRNWRGYIWLTVTILFMLLIFIKSAEPYHEQDLKPTLATWVPLSVLEKWLPHLEFQYDNNLITWQNPYDMLEFFIRKGAHITEFAMLTFLWIHSLKYTRLEFPLTLFVSAVITLLYAASDEWHQTFVSGRTGHLIDVGVDSIGIALIVLVYWLPSRTANH